MNHLAITTIIVVMTLSSFAMAGEGRSHFADSANTGRAQVAAGPDDPGLKWHIDLKDVETLLAPNFFGVVSNSELRRPLVTGEPEIFADGREAMPSTNDEVESTGMLLASVGRGSEFTIFTDRFEHVRFVQRIKNHRLPGFRYSR